MPFLKIPYHMIFVFLCLTSFSLTISGSVYVAVNDICEFILVSSLQGVVNFEFLCYNCNGVLGRGIHKCVVSVIILNHILWYCFMSLSDQHPKGRVEEHLCREMEAI